MGKRLELPAEVRALFAEAARARRLRPAACAQCGQPIQAWGRKQYCSDACRWRAYYYRRQQPRQRPAEYYRQWRARQRQQATAPPPEPAAPTTPPSAGQQATAPEQPAPPRPRAPGIRTDGGRFRWEPADD